MATWPRPIGWDPTRTHTGMAADQVVWRACTTCGETRAPHREARNGEGLIPISCRHCHIGARRPEEAT